jgi:NACHT domain- and WD repeat-containing protein
LRNLTWLPADLPEHVRLIVSTLPGECLSALEKKRPVPNLVELEPMLSAEGSDLLDLWLKDAGRTLQDDQRVEVLGRFAQNGLPLYLKLAFEEARRWKSYSLRMRLQGDIAGIVRELFRRLSADHGHLLVSRSLGYLVAAKNGLSEDELLDVLARDQEFFADFKVHAHHDLPETDAEQQRLPVIVWSRLYFDLEPYLTERSADGASLLAFYHRQISEVTTNEFLGEDNQRLRHESLARYFGAQPLWFERYKAANQRRVAELPYQQTQSELWTELDATLCDLNRNPGDWHRGALTATSVVARHID